MFYMILESFFKIQIENMPFPLVNVRDWLQLASMFNSFKIYMNKEFYFNYYLPCLSRFQSRIHIFPLRLHDYQICQPQIFKMINFKGKGSILKTWKPNQKLETDNIFICLCFAYFLIMFPIYQPTICAFQCQHLFGT